MLRPLRVLGAIFLASSLVACGGSSRDEPLSIEAIRDATFRSDTLRFRLTEESPQEAYVLTGEIDYSARRTHIVLESAEITGSFEAVVLPDRAWFTTQWLELIRREVPDSACVWVDPADFWSDFEIEDPTAVFGPFDPRTVVSELAGTDRLERIGVETIGGDELTRYRTTAHDSLVYFVVDPGSAVELWVDDQQRLRRLVGTTSGQPIELDIFDYGAAISITAPAPEDVCSE